MMSGKPKFLCPSCNITMKLLGATVIWCPDCGTVKQLSLNLAHTPNNNRVRNSRKNILVLIFTSAYYKRPLMTRQTMLGTLNQSYKKITHAVNITLDKDSKTNDYTSIYNDLLDSGIFVITYNNNYDTHFNNMTAIKSVQDYLNYDIFVKMDNDDIYKKNYISNIVDLFQYSDVDIVSSKINTQLNGHDLYPGTYDNLGGNPDGSSYRMPMTFAFNKRALNTIINIDEDWILYRRRRRHDDYIWRHAWDRAGLIHREVDNSNQVIWNIHGENLSTSKFLRKSNV